MHRLELTSFFICEMTGENLRQFGEYGVEDYLSDGVIHLVMDRKEDDVQRKLGIIKMRHARHALGYKPFNWKEEEQRFGSLISTVTDFARLQVGRLYQNKSSMMGNQLRW